MKPRSYDWWVDQLTYLIGDAIPTFTQHQAINDIANILAADDPRTRKERTPEPAPPVPGIRK